MLQPRLACAVLMTLLWAAHVGPAQAQEVTAPVRGLLTGYGAITYSAHPDSDFQNDFTATFSPLLLQQVGDDFLFEAELDLELADAGTEIHLEHAQVHYLGLEYLQITAGMFHVPFGIWMHPSWVNRMPTPPLIYQDTHGAPPDDALLPILFDVGVMAKAAVPLFSGWMTSVALWVTQGPSDDIAAHVHGDGDPAAEPHSDAPRLGYGANFEDNNSDKMVGVQLRAVSAGSLTLQGSAFRAAYDEAGDLGVYGMNLSLIWTPSLGPAGPFDIRGEGILLGQEYAEADVVESVNSGGYYLQLARRLGALEPVARWSQLPQAIAGEGPLVETRRQLALGLNYWFGPSVPIKAAYNIELDGADAIFLEWSVGF
jgi:hypothetical protein